jgi:hypothetical protein
MLIAVGLEYELIVDSSKPCHLPTTVFFLCNFEKEKLQLA